MFFSGNQIRQSDVFDVPAEKNRLYYLRFKTIFLKSEKSIFSDTFLSHETVLVLLSGKCNVTVSEVTFELGARKSVFDGHSDSLYIPAGAEFSVQSAGGECLLACVSSLARVADNEPFLIKGADVDVKTVGANEYQRKVGTIFSPDLVNGESRLRVGETYNAPGKWSSWPPHKHAVDNYPEETRYEEIYLFRISKKGGFGYLRVYNDEMDESFTVKDLDCAVVTEGYHPICAAPDTEVYYLWALSGRHPELINSKDPVFVN